MRARRRAIPEKPASGADAGAAAPERESKPLALVPPAELPAASEKRDPFDALDVSEKSFVLALLDGATWDEARKRAHWRDPRTVVTVLARAHVREALQRAALMPNVRNAALLLTPYALERLAGIISKGGDAQAIHAARDILAIAGVGPVSRSEHTTISSADIARMLSERAIDVNPGPPDARHVDRDRDRDGKRALPSGTSDELEPGDGEASGGAEGGGEGTGHGGSDG